RALIEGCACAVRANIEQLDAVLLSTSQNSTATAITLCGGLSRSPLFAQLVADMTAREVLLPQTYQTAALGAAICAGVASRDFADFASACYSLTTVRARVCAIPDYAAVNGQLYALWARFRAESHASTAPIA